MKYADLDASVRRRAVGIKPSPDGDVLELKLRPMRPKAQPDKPEKAKVEHRDDDPMCPCEECQTLFQAADR